MWARPAAYEEYREECLQNGPGTPRAACPPHFALEGGLQDHRPGPFAPTATKPPPKSKYVTWPAFLEALVGTPSAILRTDLIRRVYQEGGPAIQNAGAFAGGAARAVLFRRLIRTPAIPITLHAWWPR